MVLERKTHLVIMLKRKVWIKTSVIRIAILGEIYVENNINIDGPAIVKKIPERIYLNWAEFW